MEKLDTFLARIRQERLADLYRLNPEPIGFRIKRGARILPFRYATYELAESAAIEQGLTPNAWKVEPVYRQP